MNAERKPIKTVQKVWGTETWIVNSKKYCMKFLDINVGGCSSLHYHREKEETFYVDIGTCILECGGRQFILTEGNSITLEAAERHKFYVPSDFSRGCRIIEVSTHHDDEDVVRLEESKVLS